MSVFYIGGFPPPYGGVTTKNDNLYVALHERTDIKKIDFNTIKRKNIIEAFKLVVAFLNRRNRFVIGVAGKKTRKKLCKLLYFINKEAMKKSIIFLMGGTAANDIATDKEYQKYVSLYKCIYAETQGMVNTLKQSGLNNAGYYPNCRFRPERSFSPSEEAHSKLKCVFFSMIMKEKGADIVLDAAAQLPELSFSFYGPIDKKYEDEFLTTIKKLPNVCYNGVFSGTKDETYQELAQFDVLLLPTKYDIEGVPGILVESKIAGITCVVSNKSYNSEIIQNDVEGIVLSDNTVDELVSSLNALQNNNDKLQELKRNNNMSASHYYIDSYINQIDEIIGCNLSKD